MLGRMMGMMSIWIDGGGSSMQFWKFLLLVLFATISAAIGAFVDPIINEKSDFKDGIIFSIFICLDIGVLVALMLI